MLYLGITTPNSISLLNKNFAYENESTNAAEWLPKWLGVWIRFKSPEHISLSVNTCTGDIYAKNYKHKPGDAEQHSPV